MKKSEIMELVRSYHASVNTEPLISNVPYQKGWVRRLFNTQALGIEILQHYLESSSIDALNPDDEIEGAHLIDLLTIMMERERRLFATSSSYENAPDRGTNRVYQRLFHLLVLDYFMLEDLELGDYPGKTLLLELIKCRFDNQLLSELEQNAEALFDSEFSFSPGAKLCAGYRRLGLAHLLGLRINHVFTQQPINTQEGMSSHCKTLRLNGVAIDFELLFLKGAPYEVRFLRGERQFKKNMDKGLEWLEKAAFYADPSACLILASFYARRNDFATINNELNPEKTFEYLEKAKRFGSKLAANVLEVYPRWGRVRINDYAYEDDETEYQLRQFR